jgi:hypothetical protein
MKTAKLQLNIQPWMAEAIDQLVGTRCGITRAEVARYLLHAGYVREQQAIEAEKARKEQP